VQSETEKTGLAPAVQGQEGLLVSTLQSKKKFVVGFARF
jgi:hypothetical protein